MSRFGKSVAVFFLIAGSGCGGNLDSNTSTNNSHLACQHSVAELGSFLPDGCPLTWDDVESGHAACLEFSPNLISRAFLVGDCGAYRKIIYFESDYKVAFYYDATSGQLVAIVSGGCSAGPPEGFTVPSCPNDDGEWTRLDCPDAGTI